MFFFLRFLLYNYIMHTFDSDNAKSEKCIRTGSIECTAVFIYVIIGVSAIFYQLNAA